MRSSGLSSVHPSMHLADSQPPDHTLVHASLLEAPQSQIRELGSPYMPMLTASPSLRTIHSTFQAIELGPAPTPAPHSPHSTSTDSRGSTSPMRPLEPGAQSNPRRNSSFYHPGYLVTSSQWLVPSPLPSRKFPCKL